MGSDHNEACIVLVGGVNDGLPGWGCLDRAGICPESGRVSHPDSARSRLFGSFVDFIGARCVQLRVWLWDETDTERTPDSENKRVPPCRNLSASLGDRGVGQVGAIVGE
jgi:hypothetical protein